jgi:predicted transcriptional regulator
MRAQDRILNALKEHRKRGVSSVQLAFMTGVRNVPDAVKKLRAKGHKITTVRRDVKWQFRTYPNIGVYIWKGKR